MVHDKSSTKVSYCYLIAAQIVWNYIFMHHIKDCEPAEPGCCLLLSLLLSMKTTLFIPQLIHKFTCFVKIKNTTEKAKGSFDNPILSPSLFPIPGSEHGYFVFPSDLFLYISYLCVYPRKTLRFFFLNISFVPYDMGHPSTSFFICFQLNHVSWQSILQLSVAFPNCLLYSFAKLLCGIS